MIASINPTTHSANTETNPATKPSSGDSQVFQKALSAASLDTKSTGSVIHDRKVHHRAAAKPDNTPPASTPVSAPAASPSTLPPMLPTNRNVDMRPKAVDAASGDGTATNPPEPAVNQDALPNGEDEHNHLAGSGEPGLQSANGQPTDHEATLRDAIAMAQTGSTPANIVATGQSPGFTGLQTALPLAAASLKGAKGQPTTQPSSAASPVTAATPDRQRKAGASDEASNADSSGTGQGNSSDQGGDRTQVADVSLPQVGPVVAHAAPVAGLALHAVPTPVHASGPMPAAPAQAALVPAAYLGMMQPEAVATPFVSSARLIQSIQQSDMRVGLNSLEFGAISIHTSTDRGVITSEITLGHQELARTITSHLSAMQETPGIPQVFSVRVDTSSPTAGDSSGHSQQGPGERQQQHAGRSTQSRSTELHPRPEYNLPIPARILDGLNARLDIRI